MKNKPLIAAAITSTIAFPVLADTPKEIAQTMMNAVFTSFDTKAAQTVIAENYIQHNPAVPTSRAPIIGFIPALKDSGISVTTHRVIAEGDYVVMHNSYSNAQAFGGAELIAFDVFRIEDGLVAEHWDNITPLTAANPSGHSQIDGVTEIADQNLTTENKKVVTRFVNAILVNGDMSQLASFFDGDNYIQHNSQIGDGLSGLGAALSALAKQGITMKYSAVHQVVAEGNFVFTMSEGTFGDTPTAFFDLFRVQDGKIAEHWDVMSEISTKMAHDNGKF